MPRFNSIMFHQNRPKIKLVFAKIDKIFERWGLRPQTPEKAPPLQISGYAPESNHVFALLIFMPLEFSLTPDFKSISFHQNKAKIKLFLQKNKIFWALGAPHPHPQRYPVDRAELPDPRNSLYPMQISGYSSDIKRVMWY